MFGCSARGLLLDRAGACWRGPRQGFVEGDRAGPGTLPRQELVEAVAVNRNSGYAGKSRINAERQAKWRRSPLWCGTNWTRAGGG